MSRRGGTPAGTRAVEVRDKRHPTRPICARAAYGRTKRTTPPTEHDRNWNRLGLGFSCAPRRIEFQIRFVDERKVD